MNKKWTKELFIEAAKLKFDGKYDYSLMEYIDQYTPVSIICPFHGVFVQKPFIYLRSLGCQKCSTEYRKILLEEQTKTIHKGSLTQDFLKSVLDYNETTGVFTWKCGNSHTKEGDIAETILNKGYLGICINQKRYPAHHLAWLYVYGKFPDKQLDHINHIKTDNRIANLREVSNRENHQNMPIQQNNTSGNTSVYYIKSSKRWKASIKINGKDIHLGVFPTKEEAISARRNAEKNYKFHINHGR